MDALSDERLDELAKLAWLTWACRAGSKIPMVTEGPTAGDAGDAELA
jgi:hypothetical protein